MKAENNNERTLCARLYEVERGLFSITYLGHSPASTIRLPIYQTGTCAADARQRIEYCASIAGYKLVTWQDTLATVPG